MTAASGRELKLAIVGATGSVGAQLVELMDARRFPYSELKLFADAESSVQNIEAGEHEYSVAALNDPSELAGFDVAFLVVPQAASTRIIAANPGPILIDLSGVARETSKAPLVAPGVTPGGEIPRLAAHRMLAIPNPAAYALATILKALGAGPAPVAATVILGSSSFGKEAIASLIEQTAELLNARLDVEEGQTQLAFNLFINRDQRELAEGISSQIAELLGSRASLLIQIVRAPTLHGTALSVLIPGLRDGSVCRERLKSAPGLLLIEENADEFRGVVDAVGEEGIIVRLFDQPFGLALWSMFDGARLAALAALWAAENLLRGHDSTLA